MVDPYMKIMETDEGVQLLRSLDREPMDAFIKKELLPNDVGSIDYNWSDFVLSISFLVNILYFWWTNNLIM